MKRNVIRDIEATNPRIPQAPSKLLATQLVMFYNAKTNLSPSLRSLSCCEFNLETFSVRNALSSVMIWLTLITESLLSLDSFFGNKLLPGASISRRLDVMTAARTVFILLSLKLFEDTMTTGLRNPGPEPLGSASEAHHISPLFITILPCLRIASGDCNNHLQGNCFR